MLQNMIKLMILRWEIMLDCLVYLLLFHFFVTKSPRRNNAIEDDFIFGSCLRNALHHSVGGMAEQWLLAALLECQAACLVLCGPKVKDQTVSWAGLPPV